MTDNLPPLPEFEKWLRSVCFQAPPAYAYDLARCAWIEADKQASADVEAMAEEIQRLQNALAFWMPGVPSEEHPLHERVARDAYLLVGYDGPNNEPSAFELGHVTLAAIAQAQSCVPAVWKWVPIEPTAEMIDAAANADPERESVWAAYLSASPQPQPVQPTTDAALHEVRAHLSHINRLLDDAVPIAQAKPEQAAQPSEPCKRCDGAGGWEAAASSTHYHWVTCPDCAAPQPKD